MWSVRHFLAAGFCTTFLAIQIVVPIVQLGARRPARFGWHMWTARPQAPTFLIVMSDGTRQPADLSRYLALSRGEMDASELLPPHLCRVIPDIAAVEVRTSASDAVKVHRCR